MYGKSMAVLRAVWIRGRKKGSARWAYGPSALRLAASVSGVLVVPGYDVQMWLRQATTRAG
jgi:hypothetical protein